MLDILIKNGKILDGSGNPWFYGNLVLKDGKIVALGKTGSLEARKIIDAKGLIVSPGFIDVHTHSDIMLLARPDHEQKVRQGITTEVIGQDGLSYAPLSPRHLSMMRRYLAALNGNPDGIEWGWSSVGEFLSRFEGHASVNVIYLIPHGAIRIEAMDGFTSRIPRQEEIERMKELTARGMEEGAVGLSMGLTYPPCAYADTEELVEICRVVTRYGGIFSIHLRDYGAKLFKAIEEALYIGEKVGIPVHFAHYHDRGRSGEMLSLIDRARERGIGATVDQYPYLAGSSLLSAFLPYWAHDGGPDSLLIRLKEGRERERIGREISSRGQDWNQVFLTYVGSDRNRYMEGRSLEELIRESGKDPGEFITDLLLEENLLVAYLSHGNTEEDLRKVIRHPVMMACSDGLLTGGSPHPRSYGSFPRFLGRYVREEGVLTLEDAIRKMTSLPAQRFGLKDRGLLKEGLAADITIFNPETVKDLATYEEPCQYPEGIEYVLVNGEIVVEGTKHTGAHPGRALKPLL